TTASCRSGKIKTCGRTPPDHPRSTTFDNTSLARQLRVCGIERSHFHRPARCMQDPTLQTQGDPSMRPRPRSSLGVRCAACMLASFLLGCGETSRLLQPDDENSRRNELSAEGQAFVLAMSAMN